MLRERGGIHSDSGGAGGTGDGERHDGPHSHGDDGGLSRGLHPPRMQGTGGGRENLLLLLASHALPQAINEGGGASAFVTAEGMTRGPVVKMPSAKRAVDLKRWLEFPENMFQVTTAFNSTSRFARLSALKINIAGPYVYIRFRSITGDAMGMNMIRWSALPLFLF